MFQFFYEMLQELTDHYLLQGPIDKYLKVS